MAITINNFGSNQSNDPNSIIKAIKDIFSDLEDQLNNRAQIYTSTDGVIPAGLQQSDILITSYKGKIGVSVKSGKGYVSLTADMIGGVSKTNANFLGVKTGLVAPVLADFPKANDYGFFNKTTAVVASYLCLNVAGVLKKVALT